MATAKVFAVGTQDNTPNVRIRRSGIEGIIQLVKSIGEGNITDRLESQLIDLAVLALCFESDLV